MAFFCLFGFIFLVTQYFQFVKGYSTLSAGVHTLPFAIVAAISHRSPRWWPSRWGRDWWSGCGLLLMGGGLVMAGLTSKPDAAFFGPIIVAMVLLALGLSSITAPATEAVMGSLAADQFGAGAAVNNTTRELGGTLGVAVLGSVFASAYAPRIIRAFAPYPIPAAAKQEAHQSMAAALGRRPPGAGGRVRPSCRLRRSPPSVPDSQPPAWWVPARRSSAPFTRSSPCRGGRCVSEVVMPEPPVTVDA